jgi:murein tripeptide amidase MpaA
MFQLLLVAVCISISFASKLPVNYELFDGHKVIRTWPTSIDQLESLRAIGSHGILVDFWIEPRRINHPSVLRVDTEHYEPTINFLKEHGLRYEIQIENLRPRIEEGLREMAERVPFNAGDHPSRITLNQYHTLDDIYAYLDSLLTTYPNMVTAFTVGTSTQNRPIRGIKIGNPGMNKPAVMIDGCIHAREWLACATMIYIINELTANQTQYTNYLNNIDILIVPVVNVDGYVYTWTTNRLWRKTRSGPRNGCYGVDPNRNWGFQWGVAGTSNNPCDEIYDGPSPFSEPEVLGLANYVCANNNTIRAYFNIHTYSQDWMFPFGYQANTYPSNVNVLRAISQQAVAAIYAVNRRTFASGSITDIVYPASGSSIDYTNAVCNIGYSFGMELRPTQNDFNGFQLPENQILAGASEAWAGIRVVCDRVASGQ